MSKDSVRALAFLAVRSEAVPASHPVLSRSETRIATIRA